MTLERAQPSSAAAMAVQRWSAYPGHVDDQTLALVDRCAEGVRVVLVTNATSRLPQDLTARGLAERFDAIVNSSVVGVAKPVTAFVRR